MFACLHVRGGADSVTGRMLALASRFSLSIEVTAPATVIFSVAGLGKMIGTPLQIASEIARQGAELGLNASLAIAFRPDASLHAALWFPGVTLIPPGEEAARLGEIKISQLPMPEDMRETMSHWGIRTFAEFAALPPLGIVERFGAEGLRLQNLARGCFDRPLKLAREVVRYERSAELERPLDNLQPVLFIIHAMLTEMCRDMGGDGVASSEARLRLDFDDHAPQERTLAFPVPFREPDSMLKLLQLKLESSPPPAAVIRVALRLIPVEPRAAQSSLFCPTAPEPARLQITLARICAIVGEQNVGSPEILDTHRPDAFAMRGFAADRRPPGKRAVTGTRLALRLFRPPLAARVILERGLPRRLTAHGITGNVISYSGPWRGSGDWWTSAQWALDEWDISLSDGGLYRVSQVEEVTWLIAGVYD